MSRSLPSRLFAALRRSLPSPLVFAIWLILGTAGWAQSTNSQALQAYQAGMAAKRAGDYPTAIHQLRAATQADPQFADGWWGLAWSCISLGRNAEAVEAFRQVIRLAPLTDNGIEAAKAIERLRARLPELDLPEPEPETFMLVLSLTRGGNTDLWLADAEGNLQRRLTTHLGVDHQPAFSPDARQIVFVSDRSGARNLWALKADATGLRQLTEESTPNYSPSYAPDGRSVVFVSERSGNPELCLLDLLTGAVTDLGETSSKDLAPAWSPAGEALAFVSDRSGAEKLHIWNPATRQSRQLLTSTIPERHPIWSPDGKYLYFSWNLEGHWQICRAQSTGEGLGAVAPSPDDDRLWGLSPDEQWLLISSTRGGLSRLYLRSATGTQTKLVAQGSGEIDSAAVSPALPRSVAQILFTSKPPPRAAPGPQP